jgi:hypothetical protein
MGHQNASYRSRGYIDAYEVLDSSQAEEFSRRLDDLILRESIDIAALGYALHDRHIDADFVWEVATAPRLLDQIEELIGGDITLLGSRFVCKPPLSSHYVPWHRDATFMGLEPADVVNVFLAVDDTDEDNGCLHVIPRTTNGSRAGLATLEPGSDGFALVDQEIRLTDDLLAASVAVPLRRGQALLFTGDLLHSSSASRSGRRIALTLRYVPGTSRFRNRGQWPAISVRGDRVPDGVWRFSREAARNFEYRPVPKLPSPARPD